MPSKTFHVSGPIAVIAIGDYPMNQNAVSNPMAYLANLNFHSALPYMTIKQSITMGAMNLNGTTPVYSFDEMHYTKVEWSQQYAGHTSVTNPLFFLVVNNVVYPNGYLYNISSTGYSHFFAAHSGGGHIWLVTRHTSYESAKPSVYLNSVEVLIIG